METTRSFSPSKKRRPIYLYPIGDTSDETTVLDDGCLHEGDARCPAFASPAALVGGVYSEVHGPGE